MKTSNRHREKMILQVSNTIVLLIQIQDDVGLKTRYKVSLLRCLVHKHKNPSQKTWKEIEDERKTIPNQVEE